MRIGIIAPPWLPVPPPRGGQIEAAVDVLARGLAMAGHQVVLFTTGDSSCPVPRRWLYESAQSVSVGMILPEYHHALYAYGSAFDCDIVHGHTVVGALVAQRFPQVPVVTTNHCPFSDDLRVLYRSVTPRVHVIAVSHSQAQQAKDVPIDAVIHHGIDLSRYPMGAGGGGYVLFVGPMTPEHGARRAALVARQAGIRLVLAGAMGGPSEVQYFRNEVRPLLSPDVEYVGEVSGEEKTALLAGARAVLNPVRWPEPFSLAMVESLACGTPVVALGEGVAGEIVDHGVTGFLCRGLDDMVAAIGAVDEVDRRRCRRSVAARFSMRRMARDHVRLYEGVLAGRANRQLRPVVIPEVAGVFNDG